MILEKELSYADSDDEDIFLTCLDGKIKNNSLNQFVYISLCLLPHQ